MKSHKSKRCEDLLFSLTAAKQFQVFNRSVKQNQLSKQHRLDSFSVSSFAHQEDTFRDTVGGAFCSPDTSKIHGQQKLRVDAGLKPKFDPLRRILRVSDGDIGVRSQYKQSFLSPYHQKGKDEESSLILGKETWKQSQADTSPDVSSIVPTPQPTSRLKLSVMPANKRVSAAFPEASRSKEKPPTKMQLELCDTYLDAKKTSSKHVSKALSIIEFRDKFEEYSRSRSKKSLLNTGKSIFDGLRRNPSRRSVLPEDGLGQTSMSQGAASAEGFSGRDYSLSMSTQDLKTLQKKSIKVLKRTRHAASERQFTQSLDTISPFVDQNPQADPIKIADFVVEGQVQNNQQHTNEPKYRQQNSPKNIPIEQQHTTGFLPSRHKRYFLRPRGGVEAQRNGVLPGISNSTDVEEINAYLRTCHSSLFLTVESDFPSFRVWVCLQNPTMLFGQKDRQAAVQQKKTGEAKRLLQPLKVRKDGESGSLERKKEGLLSGIAGNKWRGKQDTINRKIGGVEITPFALPEFEESRSVVGVFEGRSMSPTPDPSVIDLLPEPEQTAYEVSKDQPEFAKPTDQLACWTVDEAGEEEEDLYRSRE